MSERAQFRLLMWGFGISYCAVMGTLLTLCIGVAEEPVILGGFAPLGLTGAVLITLAKRAEHHRAA